ncbi:MAG: efflux RND transporter periplasmic adaptor subunit [Gammaproteobacteria bacterium]
MKQFIQGVVLCCVFVFSLYTVQGAEKTAPEKGASATKPATPVPVIVSDVQSQAWRDDVQALGTTRANETVIITASTVEKITAIHFEEGQQVAAGAPLITLEQSQELAQRRAARAQWLEAQQAYQRANDLKKNRALSEASVQARLAALTRAEVQVAVIDAQLAELSITAPFAGTLGLREISVGALVKPGDRITTLDDLSVIKVDFEVPTRYLDRLHPGAVITGTVSAYPNRVFHGVVRVLNTQVNTMTRALKVRAVIDNEEAVLRPGLLMSVRLQGPVRQALVIPEAAVLKRGKQNVVFALSMSAEPESDAALSVEQRTVQLGSRRQGVVEVLAGLTADDTIVVHGVNKLRSGAEVMVRARQTHDEPLSQLLAKPQDAQEPE